MTSQSFDATIGGVVYNVSVSSGGGGVANPTGWYSIDAYGAVGDGATDDLARIQAAVDAAEAAGGGTVFFPNNDYAVSSFIVVDSDNVELLGGGGARIIAATGSGDFVLKVSAAGCKVRDLTFVGGVSTEPAAANECISLLSGAEDTEITGCKFTGASASTGFNVHIRAASGCLNPRIVSNHFERVVGENAGYGYNIQMASIVGGIVSDNTIIQGTSSLQGRHHIYLAASASDVTVSGNRLYGGNSAMITVYSNTTAAQRISIVGNVLDGGGTGGGTGGGIEMVDEVSDSLICGNIISNVAAYGIKLEGAGDVSSECVDNAVIGNVIVSPGSNGIYLKGAERSFISGNRIKGVDGEAAILIRDTGSSTSDDSTFIGNYVTGSTHTYALDASSADISIMANHLVAGTSGTFANISPNTRKTIGNFSSDWPVDFAGSGDPEGNMTAVVGSLYRRTNSGGAGRTLYIKESGTGNTGWNSLGGGYVRTATADDTTPTVQDVDVLLLPDNTGATAITQLDDAEAGQGLTLIVTGSSNTPTIADGGNFNLSAAWSPGTGDTLTLVTSNGTTWYEVCRSNN